MRRPSTIEGRSDDEEVGMAAVEPATEIRPFQVDIPEEALEDLRRRIEATRLPSKSSSKIDRRAIRLATIRGSRLGDRL